MSGVDFQQFAHDWEAGWNSHDLDRILAHYSEDVVFHSRKAQSLAGSGRVEGRRALRAYWAAALAAQPQLTFRVQEVFEGHDMMVIRYLNHRDRCATETLYFDENGRVIQAAACHLMEAG